MAQLFFKKRFQIAIREGVKTTTIRRWDRSRIAPGQRIYSPGLGWLLIGGVERIDLDQINDQDAKVDGFITADELRTALAMLYPPGEGDGKEWFRVKFTLDEPAPRRGRRHAVEEKGLFDTAEN